MSGNGIVGKITKPIGSALRPVTNLLFGDEEDGIVPPKTPPTPPSRDQVVSQILLDQLNALDKKKQTLGGTGASQDSASLATTTLFGV